MNWGSIVQCLNLTLGVVLIIKLFSIKLQRVYKLFCLFLAADLVGSALWILSNVFGLLSGRFYAFSWLITRSIAWLFTLLMVYSLLEKILSQLPGLLSLSKRVLYAAFSLAIIVGLISARFEYSASGFMALHGKQFLVRCWVTGLVLERVIASTALLSLLAILAFLLWFPVTIPKNLAVFSIGFTVYFVGITVLMLVRSLWPDEARPIMNQLLDVVSTLIGVVTGLCFAFWLFLLSPAGEAVPAALTIQRQPQEQERLIAQLELINDTLLKAARH